MSGSETGVSRSTGKAGGKPFLLRCRIHRVQAALMSQRSPDRRRDTKVRRHSKPRAWSPPSASGPQRRCPRTDRRKKWRNSGRRGRSCRRRGSTWSRTRRRTRHRTAGPERGRHKDSCRNSYGTPRSRKAEDAEQQGAEAEHAGLADTVGDVAPEGDEEGHDHGGDHDHRERGRTFKPAGLGQVAQREYREGVEGHAVDEAGAHTGHHHLGITLEGVEQGYFTSGILALASAKSLVSCTEERI